VYRPSLSLSTLARSTRQFADLIAILAILAIPALSTLCHLEAVRLFGKPETISLILRLYRDPLVSSNPMSLVVEVARHSLLLDPHIAFLSLVPHVL